MSNLVRSCTTVMTAPRSPPPTHPLAATTPAKMNHLLVGPRVSQAPTSLASLVALPVSARSGHHWPRTPDTPSASTTDASGSQQGFVISLRLTLILYFFAAKKNTQGSLINGRITLGYDERHRAAPTAEQHSALAHNIGHVVWTYCPMQWKSWKVMPDEVRNKVHTQLSTNYNFEDMNDDMLEYINRLFSERYKQWKSDLHQYFEAFEDPQVEDNWVWLSNQFQEPGYVKVKANKSNRDKKTLLHHSGSRPFSYRMEAGVQNSRRSMSLATFMFDPGMSWASFVAQ
ncbi:hypothetical protein D8674_019296 [Pyrus ussuriensis x Pyrus communis]|uniref:Uncharacterized protein n=1 Tax=Pyrus ussuriensis x Pyrus communis TaxID=2448454 RepID=A0A5N5GKI5_9ROSA|nr:hypothetical protein D8674_019296 [Pyrus ussuriensis x Pyrus communis]